MTSIFGKTAREEASDATTKANLRTEVVKRIALGGGWSVGASVVFGAYELLRGDPHDAFPLLRAWGPWAIVALVSLYVVYDLTKMVLNIGQRAVSALEELALAQQSIAGKDDVQLQEIQTLNAYTAQQSERMYAKLVEHFDLTTALGVKVDTLMRGKGIS